MRILLALVVILTSTSAFSQTIKFDSCATATPIFYRAEIDPKFKAGDKALENHLSSALEASGVSQKDGDLLLSLYVLENGNVCLFEITQKKLAGLDVNQFRNLINKMSGWKPASQNGHIVGCVVKLELTIEKGKLLYLTFK